jgi:hypothetical protein
MATIILTPPGDHCDAYMLYIDEPNLKVWLKPDNLPSQFEQDGLRVSVTYLPTDQTHNCGFGGYKTVIQILKITKL